MILLVSTSFCGIFFSGGVRIVEIKDLIQELKDAHENLEVFRNKETEIVKEEIQILLKITKELFPFATKKVINGEEALLIYVYGRDDKEFISHEVYLTKSGEIAYQVYDQKRYIGYVPEADIRGGFVYNTLEQYLRHKPLKDIFEFFLDRIDVLYEYASETSHFNKERLEFLAKMKNIL